jgi:Uncharacterized protein conserved in bacteria
MIQREKARRHLLDFTKQTHPNYKAGWFHHVLCRKLVKFLRDIEDGKQPRLMIMAPPRHGKSAIVSERFPVFALGHHPDWQIMSASYSASIAEKFSRKARAIAKEKNVQAIFPNLRLDTDRTAVEEWETTEGGVYKAIGVGGSGTGAGANILSIDDPIKGGNKRLVKHTGIRFLSGTNPRPRRD